MRIINHLYKKLSNSETVIITDNSGFVVLMGLYRALNNSDPPITLKSFIMDDITLENFTTNSKYSPLSNALQISKVTSSPIKADDLIDEIIDWYDSKGIYQILKQLKYDFRATTVASYELLTGKSIKLKGMSGVYLLLLKNKKNNIPIMVIGKEALKKLQKQYPHSEVIQYSYEQLKNVQKNEITKLSALVHLLENIFAALYNEEVGYLNIPTDKGSSEFTTFTLQKKTRTLKEKFIKLGEVTITIGNEQKKVKAEELDIFLSSLPHRTGDVYNYLLHKAYHQGFTRTDENGSQRVLDITAQEIANVLSPSGKAGRKLKETVAKILGEKLPAITIRVPITAFTPDILKKLKVNSKSSYISFSPLIYLMGESEDDFYEKETRLYRAVIAINPLLWALYAEIGMKASIPIEVLRLNPQYTPERWAKMMTYKLYYYARINQRNTTEHKIRMRTLLENTGILDEIKEMIAKEHHQRAFSYLKQSLELMQTSLFKKFVILPKHPENLDEFLNSTLNYIVKQPYN